MAGLAIGGLAKLTNRQQQPSTSFSTDPGLSRSLGISPNTGSNLSIRYNAPGLYQAPGYKAMSPINPAFNWAKNIGQQMFGHFDKENRADLDMSKESKMQLMGISDNFLNNFLFFIFIIKT